MLALIGCANAAGLLLARSAARQREIAIRKAIGAGRLRIVGSLLAEGFVLAGGGTVVGYLLHAAIAARLRLLTYPGAYAQPYEFNFETDTGLLLYTAALALAAMLVSSLVPALRFANADLSLFARPNRPSPSSVGGCATASSVFRWRSRWCCWRSGFSSREDSFG